MPLIHACLFDLDGVIVDTAKYHYTAWRQLAKELGFDLSPTQNELLKGISRMESLDIILAIGGVTLSEEEKLARAAEKNSRYLALCSQMTPEDTLPGVRMFMDGLRKTGIKIGLGSVSKNALIILESIGMRPYFDSIVDGNRVTKGKPDPQVFQIGAADLSVAPENCIVFEDAVAGISAAKSAGMYAVGVGSAAVLTEADTVIAGFQDITFDQIKKSLSVI